MSYRQAPASHSLTKGFRLGLNPAPAWTLIFGLILLTALGILVGNGKILNLAFPAGAFVVGVFLYFRAPMLYMGFSWWMWLITPLIRRLADYRSGFTEPSPMLLAPYLVGLVTLVTLWQHLPKSRQQGSLPLVLSLVGVFYAFLIGLINRSPFIAARNCLDWLVPITFGFHLFVNWQHFPRYYQNIQRTFLWGVLVIGGYAIFQYVTGPAWDVSWLINSNMIIANGYHGQAPGPFTIRVFSTMQSTEPFAAFMAAALLLLFTSKEALRLPASTVGYLAFLLSLVRSAWIAWLAGLLTLASTLKLKHQISLIISGCLVIAVLLIPLTTLEPLSENIGNRVQTLSNVQEDDSAQGRQENFRELIVPALTNFVGEGIGGGKSLDSEILSMLFDFGWLGTIPYLAGMILLLFRLFQSSKRGCDLFTGTARAIVVTVLVRLPVNSSLRGVSGVILWGFLGLGLAADKYYQHQRNARLGQSLPQSSP